MRDDDALKIIQPPELSFDRFPESDGESKKRLEIEKLIKKSGGVIKLSDLQHLAISEFGFVNDDLRRTLWPILAGVDAANLERAPCITELQSHPEYHQVVLDVNRSLKRFPPGIPYEQRISLQDQLTILILRVITKYPNLRYYQGYHDVAVTFLLVVGEQVAYAVMEQLSITHFSECMQETMKAIQKRLLFIWPIVYFENPDLFKFLEQSSVGVLFALPWYLTWFGHSLNNYKTVVRLYDYFLASPMYSPIFVTAAIILYRANDIFLEDCDMASIHCLLSKLPDDLPFEELLKTSSTLYEKYSLTEIEKEVDKLVQKEKDQQHLEDQVMLERRNKRRTSAKKNSQWLPYFVTPRSIIVTAACSIVIGICAYCYKVQYLAPGIS